jgi:hypothetical protein
MEVLLPPRWYDRPLKRSGGKRCASANARTRPEGRAVERPTPRRSEKVDRGRSPARSRGLPGAITLQAAVVVAQGDPPRTASSWPAPDRAHDRLDHREPISVLRPSDANNQVPPGWCVRWIINKTNPPIGPEARPQSRRRGCA